MRGGDVCIDSGGLKDELGPEALLEDGSGCGNCSEVSWCSWWDPFGRDVGNVMEFTLSGFRVVFSMPLVTGDKSSEGVVEGGKLDEGIIPIIDVGRGFPLVFTPFSGVSFEGVVGGGSVFPLVPRLPTLDGRDGGLTMGAGVDDNVLECRFGFSQSADIVWGDSERQTLYA